MVTITLYMEGGVLANPRVPSLAINNSAALRQSLKLLFEQGIDDTLFRFIIEMGGGEKQAIKFFEEKHKLDSNALLLIDLDNPKSQKEVKLAWVCDGWGIATEDAKARIFFMIQTMESWILSQPDKIEHCYLGDKISTKPLAEDEILAGKHPEDIAKPADKLNTLLARHFEYDKAGKKKKRKYASKLKDAADLIEKLDLARLRKDFDEVEALITRINSSK
jgi:hypothetical protein